MIEIIPWKTTPDRLKNFYNDEIIYDAHSENFLTVEELVDRYATAQEKEDFINHQISNDFIVENIINKYENYGLLFRHSDFVDESPYRYYNDVEMLEYHWSDKEVILIIALQNRCRRNWY